MTSIRIVTEGEPVELSVREEGRGEPVLLIHGFASTKEVNWVDTGWMKALAGASFRAIAFDNRGHGASTKFHADSDYRLEKMAADAIGLLDALGLSRAHVCGYSMGARIAAYLAATAGGRLDRIVLSGAGWNLVDIAPGWDAIADALLAPSIATIPDRRGRAFRAFAEQTKSDRVALACCIRGARRMLTPAELGHIANPVLVAVGTDDDIATDPQRLAAAIPGARYFPIAGRDHMRSVGDRAHVRAALEFLREG
jgi:pimeloyl-ACP methyl ester carboxylesterase